MGSVHKGRHNFPDGIRVPTSDDNVTATPTEAEIIAAFGTAAAVGDGFVGLIDDNGGGTAGFICWSDGSSWLFAAGTVAS